jgi:hypothetical protein
MKYLIVVFLLLINLNSCCYLFDDSTDLGNNFYFIKADKHNYICYNLNDCNCPKAGFDLIKSHNMEFRFNNHFIIVRSKQKDCDCNEYFIIDKANQIDKRLFGSRRHNFNITDYVMGPMDRNEFVKAIDSLDTGINFQQN